MYEHVGLVAVLLILARRREPWRDRKPPCCEPMVKIGPAVLVFRVSQMLLRSSRVGQESAGSPSRCCSDRTAARVMAPRMPSIPPTS